MAMDDSSQATDEAQTTDNRTARAEDITSAPAPEPSSLPPPAPVAPHEQTPQGKSRHVFAAMGTTVTVLAPAEHGSRAIAFVRALAAGWVRAPTRLPAEVA